MSLITSSARKQPYFSDAAISVISVTVIQAVGLVAKDGPIMIRNMGPNSDPYCKVFLGGRMIGRTSTVYKNLSPEWNEQVNSFIDFVKAKVYRYWGPCTLNQGIRWIELRVRSQ